MNTTPQHHNDRNEPDDQALALQRCVDGELDTQQEMDLLKRLDNAGDQAEWRRLALAFMEERAIQKYFDNDDQLFAKTDKVKVSPSEDFSTVAPSSAVWNTTAGPASRSNVPKIQSWSGKRRWIGEWITVSACLCFSFWAGQEVGLMPEPETKTSEFANAIPPADAAAPIANFAAGPSPLFSVRMVQHTNKGSEEVVVPVYESAEAKAEALAGETFGSDTAALTLDELEQLGYAVERGQRQHRVSVGQNREVILPSSTYLIKQSLQ